MYDNSWKKFVAAAVQAAPVMPLSREKTTEKILDLMSQAKKEGADLLEPVYYLAAGAEDWIVPVVCRYAAEQPRWVIPGR